jgi:hypothetical protein
MGKSALNMPQFTPDEIEGLRRCFVLYVQMPRERWNEIEKAELLTPEGDELYQKLKQECLENYMYYGDYDEELGKTEKAPVMEENSMPR